jgi:phage baseplate assembly protein gpV
MLLLAVGCAASLSANAENFSVNIPQLQDEGKQVVMKLVSTLGGELKAAKEEGGAIAAINVCNNKFSL